jgi:hypothetical protein
MALVRSLGWGYYAIESDGVKINRSVTDTIDAAFTSAQSIPTKKLRIQGTEGHPKTKNPKHKK